MRESVHGCITSAPASSARASSAESKCSRPSARPQPSNSACGEGMSAARMVSPAYSPTRRICGPVRANRDTATPSSRSNGQLVAETNSPHTFRRGNGFFSATATLHPAFASRIAAVAPAGPPPTISASYSVSFSIFIATLVSSPAASCRQKAVAEQTSRVFVDLPGVRLGPRGRQLRIAKPGAHAQYCIVARDRIASEQADEVAADECRGRASRFAGNKRVAAGRDAREQQPERLVCEMVQEQIRERQVVGHGVRFVNPLEHVAGDDAQCPPKRRETLSCLGSDEVLPVHDRGLDPGPLRRPPAGEPQ